MASRINRKLADRSVRKTYRLLCYRGAGTEGGMAADGDSVTNKMFAPPLGTVRHNYRKVSRHGRGPSGSLRTMSVDGNDESDGALLESSTPRGPSPVAEYNEAIIQESGGAWQLAEMVVLAGRTHQIRLQMAALGFPVIGDSRYGDPLLFRNRAGSDVVGYRDDNPS
eukprot:gene3790-4731_t